MKKYLLYTLLFLISLGFSSQLIKAQQVNTMYFMDNMPMRHILNPAFQPLSNVYISFPVIGLTQFGAGNNSLSMKDLIFNQNGQTISFLHPKAVNGKENLLNSIKPTTLLGADIQLNLFSFGFRKGASYNTFTVKQKIELGMGIPKDFMKLLLFGTPDAVNTNVFDFKTLGLNATSYTEAAFGNSTVINDQWTVGGKFKVLVGQANISTVNKNLSLEAGANQWVIKGEGEIRTSTPFLIEGDSLNSLSAKQETDPAMYAKPYGVGVGADFGFTYKPIEQLVLSAAVTDLGVINWKINSKKIAYKVDYAYTGPGISGVSPTVSKLGDSIFNTVKNSATTTISDSPYNTYTHTKINLGAEYNLWDNALGFGLLSRTMFRNQTIFQEVTTSINLHPVDWFNLSTSYSMLNGRSSNIGVGVGLRTFVLQWFLSADYVPMNYAHVGQLLAPYNTTGVNLALGLNFVFGNKRDADKDGVSDRKDKCPDTPLLAKGKVDKKGCPLDSDGDGVSDYLDQCPDSPILAAGKVDSLGCPLDTDGDKIADYLDHCPNTPLASINMVDSVGCSSDLDKDGVLDYLDKCLNTPAGVQVDSVGCPVDTDGDGVADYLDKCPATPLLAHGAVDALGCPLDSDGDGVPNYMDKCPNTNPAAKNSVNEFGCGLDKDGDGVEDYLDKCPGTPSEARGKVDSIGCPLDTDGDGVPDYLDKCPDTLPAAKASVDATGCAKDTDGDGVADYLDTCPDTPSKAKGLVNATGCPIDSDGDGIFDFLDNCPNLPGVAANFGCPDIKTEVKTLFKKALQGIQFESGKGVIVKSSYAILNQISKVLLDNPTYLIDVRGHTDNVGKVESNLLLSEIRAKAVSDYILAKGIALSRLTSHGFGDSQPVADNKTTAGKAKNRRVEFVVTFEETTIK